MKYLYLTKEKFAYIRTYSSICGIERGGILWLLSLYTLDVLGGSVGGEIPHSLTAEYALQLFIHDGPLYAPVFQLLTSIVT